MASMRFLILVLGIASLFLNSLNNISESKKTNPTNPTKVCFEQREFDLFHEFEKNETNLLISLEEFSKKDNKRTNDYTDRQTSYQYNLLFPVSPIQIINRSFLNLFFVFNKSQSILQVFLL